MKPSDCRDCGRAPGFRLCRECFHDFLGWLSATRLEAIYWQSWQGRRRRYIDMFIAHPDDPTTAFGIASGRAA
jgi:hypothetical protein